MTRFDAFAQRSTCFSQIVNSINRGLFHRQKIKRSKDPDIGIFASLDLLAVEQASVDAVYDLGEASAPLRERIESRHGLRQLSAMREIGLGSENYEIVDLDKA